MSAMRLKLSDYIECLKRRRDTYVKQSNAMIDSGYFPDGNPKAAMVEELNRVIDELQFVDPD